MAYAAEVLADSPIGYWRLGEPSGTTAASEVNSPTADGTYRNTPSLGVAGALSGDSNTAVSFASASSEDVNLSDNALWQVGDVITVEAWIKRASIGSVQVICSKHATDLTFQMNASDLLQAFKHSDSAIVASTLAITDTTTWHHVVYTKNGATNVLYIDGADVTGTVDNKTLGNQNIFRIASNTSEIQHLNGALDEVALYGTALTAARVLAHYNAGGPLGPSPLPLLIPSPVRW